MRGGSRAAGRPRNGVERWALSRESYRLTPTWSSVNRPSSSRRTYRLSPGFGSMSSRFLVMLRSSRWGMPLFGTISERAFAHPSSPRNQHESPSCGVLANNQLSDCLWSGYNSVHVPCRAYLSILYPRWLIPDRRRPVAGNRLAAARRCVLLAWNRRRGKCSSCGAHRRSVPARIPDYEPQLYAWHPPYVQVSG